MLQYFTLNVKYYFFFTGDFSYFFRSVIKCISWEFLMNLSCLSILCNKPYIFHLLFQHREKKIEGLNSIRCLSAYHSDALTAKLHETSLAVVQEVSPPPCFFRSHWGREALNEKMFAISCFFCNLYFNFCIPFILL